MHLFVSIYLISSHVDARSFLRCTVMVDPGGKILVVQERGVAQGGTVLLQRHDQPGRRRAGRADRQGPAPDRMQSVLRFFRTGKPGAAETGAVGVRPVEQGGGLLSGVQHVGRAHTASDGKKRIRRPEGTIHCTRV